MAVASLAVSVAFAADKPAAKTTAAECTKDWSTEGQMKSKSYIYGLGVSSKKEKSEAIDEAKSAAMREVSTQLQASIKSESTVNETESGATYSGKINVATNGQNLTGIRIVKEGANATSNFTHCAVAKFDVGAAYAESEGQMNVLEKELSGIFAAAKAKKYIEVLQKREKAHVMVTASAAEITRADMFRGFLKADSESWFEKIKGRLADVDKIADEAKSQIVFILPEGTEYEGTMSDVESKLSGLGFEVIRSGKAGKPVALTLEVKPVGTPRKTKTALGQTVIARIGVNLKEGGRTIASNKGAQVTGTGNTDDDAIANIDRQLLVHVLGVLHDGLPGLIPDNE